MGRRIQSYPNAVLRWKLNDTGLPFVNSGTAGTAMNLANLGNNAVGVVPGQRSILSRGVTFPGTDGTITDRNSVYTANPSADSHIISGRMLTVSCWVNFRRFIANGYVVQKMYDSTISNFNATYNGATWELGINSSGLPLFAVVAGTAGSGTRGAFSGTVALLAGTWYLLAGTYDGSKVRLYINGVDVSVGGTSLTGNIDNSTTNSNRGGPYAVGGTVSTNVNANNLLADCITEEVVAEAAVIPEDMLRDRYLRGMGLYEADAA